MKTRGIYLDEPFTNALIVLGYNEGIIPSYTGGECDYEKKFISKFTNPEFAKIALQNLVLYKKAFLHPFDNFVTDGLQKEGIVEIPHLDSHFNKGTKLSGKDVIERGLFYPTLVHLRSKGFNISAKKFIEILESGYLENYRNLVDEYYKSMWTLSINKNEMKKIKNYLSFAISLLESLDCVSRLIEASSSLEVPALWNCPTTPFTTPVSTVTPVDTTVAAIYFKELKRIKVNSITDAIELIEHKAVDDFRNEILEMTKRVCNGEASEEYIIKRIHSANRILKACELAEKIGTVITLVGIPASAIPALGSMLAFAGGGIVTSEFAIKRKYNWALISNR